MTLLCDYCGEKIRKSDHEHTEETLVFGHSQVERAYHTRCAPSYVPPDTPWQAAVAKLKQAVADAKRLSPSEQASFWAVFAIVSEQRDG